MRAAALQAPNEIGGNVARQRYKRFVIKPIRSRIAVHAQSFNVSRAFNFGTAAHAEHVPRFRRGASGAHNGKPYRRCEFIINKKFAKQTRCAHATEHERVFARAHR